MNQILLTFCNMLLNTLELLVLLLLAGGLFATRLRRLRYAAAVLLLFLLHIGILQLFGDIPVLRITFQLLLDTVWIVVVCGAQVGKALVLSVFYVSFLAAADSVLLYTFSLLTGQPAIEALQNPYFYYLFCYSIKIAEIFGALAVRTWLQNRFEADALPWQAWLRTLLLPAMSTVISFSLFSVYPAAPEAAPQLLLCAVILVLVNGMAIFLLRYLERQQKELQNYAVLSHAIKCERDNVNAWMNAYANQRKQTHDFQNQLLTVQGLVKQECPEGAAAQYIEQLLQTDFTGALLVKTGRPVVDAILNQKHALAQTKGIRLTVQLDDLRSFALPDDALVVVLANLLDNAIEAVSQIEFPEKRVVRLRMTSHPEVNFLYIENPSPHPIRIKGNRVLTTKKDSKEHGYGLQNIASILRQYNGIYAIDYDEETGLFRFSAQIIPSVSELA